MFFLVACYTPNSGSELKRLDYRVNEWDVDFSEFLDGLRAKNKTVIVAGDLNVAHNAIDIYDAKGKDKIAGFTPRERKSFNEFFINKNYIDTFRYLYPNERKFSFWSPI